MKTINPSPQEEKKISLSINECLIIFGTIFISCAALVALCKSNNPQLRTIATRELKQSVEKGMIISSDLLKKIQTLPNINQIGKRKLCQMLIQAQFKEKIYWKGIKDGIYYWTESLRQQYIS